MTTNNSATEKPTYDQFREEWLGEIENFGLSSFDKGLRFGSKLVSQWLGVDADDADFIICDGSGDGGIDIAYLQRADALAENQSGDTNAIEGDTWYLVQSKYGTAFSGSDTIVQEGMKVLRTLNGQSNLSDMSRQVLEKLDTFRAQASDVDRISLVFATTDPISQQDRLALDSIRTLGRERIIPNFDVEEVSLKTVWESLSDVEASKISVPLKGQFVEQYAGLLVGTVTLTDLFAFLQAYQNHTGSLDQIYEKNVRQFLGNRRKINKGIANTLNTTPEKFGLYNNGITVVVSGYSKVGDDIVMRDPYIVNGCQTTRTIWQVLDSRLNAGGTGKGAASVDWRERVNRGGVVTKVVTSDEVEITNITRFTNSQNSVREQDFIALDKGFQNWAAGMASDYNIFLEIQRGGTESRKAWEKQHPNAQTHDDYVNAFDLIKVYGAGWLGVPGLAYGKNAPFLPNGNVYERMVSRENPEPSFGPRDLYAAYKLKGAADELKFGRNANVPSRRQSRFLFYHVAMRILHDVILLTPELHQPDVSPSVLTDAVIKLNETGLEKRFGVICDSAVGIIDQYLTFGTANDQSAYNEKALRELHNGDLNGFLKSENLGRQNHSPLLWQALEINKMGFGSIRAMPGGLTQREFVAQALM